jgi:homoserine O-succinyltransferase
MPIKIQNELPAREALEAEKIFVITEKQALEQDIRPLEVAILNLMPKKIQTEIQLARLLGNTPLQVNLTLLTTESYTPTNVSSKHLGSFYKTWSQVKHKKFDGLIITGAPVETKPWDEIVYWEELKNIFEWSKTNVWSNFYICWGAQAALHYFYDIPKYELNEKRFGVFKQRCCKKRSMLMRGFDDEFNVPVSRHTEIRKEDILKHPELTILSESPASGLYIVENERNLFVFNHSEYEVDTLKEEYERDKKKHLSVNIPHNYFPDDDPSQVPVVRWRSHAHLLFSNWLNYYVYQQTPYDINSIS